MVAFLYCGVYGVQSDDSGHSAGNCVQTAHTVGSEQTTAQHIILPAPCIFFKFSLDTFFCVSTFFMVI